MPPTAGNAWRFKFLAINWKKLYKRATEHQLARFMDIVCKMWILFTNYSNSIYGCCCVPAWWSLLLSGHSELRYPPKSPKMNQKCSFCILLIISHKLSNFRAHGYLLQGAKGWPCSFCDITFWMALFTYFDSGRLSFFAVAIVPGYVPQMCPRVWNIYGNPKTSEGR